LGRKVQGAAFGASFLLPLLAPTIERQFGKTAGGAVGGAGIGLSIGSLFGPLGALAGGAVGGGIGALMGSQKDKKSPVENLQSELENLKESFNQVSNGANSYIQTQSQLNALFESGNFNGKDVKKLLTTSNNSLQDVSKKNPELAKRLAGASSQDERANALEEFRRSELDKINQKERGLGILKITESQKSKTGEFAGLGSEILASSIFGSKSPFSVGGISPFAITSPISGIAVNAGAGILKTIEGANRATFSTDQVNAISDTIFSDIDVGALSKRLEGEGKDIDQFFQELARTTRGGFDGKEFETFVKELGLSEDVADSLRSFRNQFGDLGNSVIAQAFQSGRLQGDFKNSQEAQLLNEISIRAIGAKKNLGEKFIRSGKLQRGRFENTRLADRTTADLGFSAREADLARAGVFGRDTMGQRQAIEREKLSASIKKEEDTIVDTFGNQITSLLTPLIKDGDDNFALLSEKVSQISNGNIEGFRGLKELLKDNPEATKELTALVDNAALQVDQLKVLSEGQREGLKIQQELEQAIKSLEGFRSRTEDRLGQNIDSLFNKGDDSIVGRVRAATGNSLTDKERRNILKDPSSPINKVLKDAATQQIQGSEALISTLPESLQNKARSVFQGGLQDASQPTEFGGGGLEKQDLVGRGEFAIQKLLDFFSDAAEKGLITNEGEDNFTNGLLALRGGVSDQGKFLSKALEETAFKDIFGKKSTSAPIINAENRASGKGLAKSQAELADAIGEQESIEKQKQKAASLKDEGLNQEDYINQLQGIAKEMKAIAEKKAQTSVEFNDKIVVGIQEDGKITTEKFDNMDEALKALKERVENLTRRLQGLAPKPPTGE
jgi:uncharacterized membrane protein